MAAFTVNNSGDTGPGSLRQAILDSNGSTASLPNQISFAALPAGLNVIIPATPLPAITASVTIDGGTAPGYSATNPQPVVVIDGSGQGAGGGFTISTNNVTIRSLDITNITGAGITINGGGKDTIAGNYIGIDATGTRAGTNVGTGIVVGTATNVTIGGPTAADRNVIAAFNTGIQLAVGSITNQVTGNYVGTTAQGDRKLGANQNNAIEIDSPANTIDNNILSGYGYGIQVLNGAQNNLIAANRIGTDVTGNAKIPNTFDGIFIRDSAQTTIGGSTAGAGNVISGNNRDGIQVTGLSPLTRIIGNAIGIGADNSTRLGNGSYGILFNGGGGSSTVGGSVPLGSPNAKAQENALGNTIAYNGAIPQGGIAAAGVFIAGASNDGVLSNSIFGNAGLGIQLNGSNNGVRPPTILTALSGGNQTRITGMLFENQTGLYRIQFFSSTTPNPLGTGDGMTFLGDANVTTDNLGNAAINFILPSAVAFGSYITATATENPDRQINNSSQFSNAQQVGQAIVADLAVTVAPVPGSPPNPLVGQPFIYQVTVTNNPNNLPNNNDATGVVLTDALPANSTLISQSTTPGATIANGTLTYNVGNLANGASRTFFIAVNPGTSRVAFTDTANVATANIDPDLTNNTASYTATGGVLADAQLVVSLIPNPSTTPVGTPLTYVLTVSNQGPSTAPNATTTVTLPASFTNISASPDQGTYTLAGNVLTIRSGIIASGSGSTITILATPTTTGTFPTTASVTSTIINPNPGGATTTVPVNVVNAADLGISISAAPDPVLAGGELRYTIVVTNTNGPSTATTPVVTDILPAGVTFVPADSSDSGGGTLSLVNGQVVATLRPIPAGGTDTITVAVIPNLSGQLVNSVTVADPNLTAPSEIDPDPTNNSATVTSLVSPADVAVTIGGPADPLAIGAQAVYQVQVTNNGPATATNVLVTDTFGANVRIVGATAPGLTFTPNGNVIVANLGSLANGSTTTLTVTVIPTASGAILDTAAVQADQIDPNPSNNSAVANNLVNPADLAVTVTGSPGSVVVGAPITYLVTVTNTGPTTAANVILNNSLPAGSTLISSRASQGAVALAGTALTGNLGTLAPGASATVTIVVSSASVASDVDTASVTSDAYDPNPANNTASATVGVTNSPGTIQFASPLAYYPENAGTITLTLTRTAGTLGTVTVAYATVADTAVPGVNFVSSSGTVTFLDGQATASISIPVLDDGVVNGNFGFFVNLTSPTGGANLGFLGKTAVVVVNTNRDTTPPVVVSYAAIPNGQASNGFVITFNKPMDPSRAGLASNYHVFISNRDSNGRADTPVPLAAALYNPFNNSVTLVPTRVLPANQFYRVVVNGSYGLALTDASGNVLSGDAGPGSNFTFTYGRGTNFRYIDSQNNAVTITLTGPGSLAITRGGNGDASLVALSGIVARKTRLLGGVKKINRASTGQTTIGAITGLGRFGDVYSTLTTPGFYVISPPVFADSISTPGTVASASVRVGTGTPRGPKR